ncbi:nucleotidyltransferase family protein [Massilia agilis]|uniref:Nucleotidyltransferase family protein n=1 Tax=Massilia agilis TaxID=1811226 RepID=A0ABT2DHK2_9BURK|nr:nucleotidyltransferase family protein [Massilia agilis]
MTPVGILLAAGRGSRFDPSGARNKLLELLPCGEPVVARSARHLLAAMPRVVAVVGPHSGDVVHVLRTLGCEVIICDEAGQGMAASLVHAIRHSLPDAQAWIVALGDMPFVRPATIEALGAALSSGADIAAPVFKGRRGNPVGFSQTHLAALLALQGDQGARAILQANPVTQVEVDDPGVVEDIDEQADLSRGRDSR